MTEQDNAVYFIDAAITHASKEEFDDCINYLTESLKLKPNNPIAVELLDECSKLSEKKQNRRHSNYSVPPLPFVVQ